MPCTDGGPSREQLEQGRAAHVALCAVVRHRGLPFVLECLDQEAHGEHGADLVAWVTAWWATHSAADTSRRSQEAAYDERMRLRANALRKLTLDELEALRATL